MSPDEQIVRLEREVARLAVALTKAEVTIDRLLAVPDEMRAKGLSHSVHLSLTRRMAAVVEGERNG